MERKCVHCGAPLPRNSSPRRKYCDMACNQAAYYYRCKERPGWREQHNARVRTWMRANRHKINSYSTTQEKRARFARIMEKLNG